MQPLPGMLQTNRPASLPIIESGSEASRYANKELMQLLVSVRAAIGIFWNAVHVENPLDFERNMTNSFDEGEIAPDIPYPRQLQQSAILDSSHYSP
jgi:hypothetical protein